MIKVFTLNNYGKIEFTKEELQDLLNEAYWDGRRSVNNWTYTYPTTTNPYNYTTITTSSSGSSITCETKPIDDFKSNNYDTVFLTGMSTDKDNLDICGTVTISSSEAHNEI